MKKTLQRGFTLIEILVALAILSVLALLAANAFDGSRSKAQAMIALGKQVGDANLQLKTDTGCYVNRPQALFDETAAQVAANNYCGRAFGKTWSRPYLAQYPVDGNGNLMADKISAGVTVSLRRAAGGLGNQYSVRFSDVPTEIVRQALIECNNSDDAAGDLATDRCAAGDLSLDSTTFDMLYSTTR